LYNTNFVKKGNIPLTGMP